MAKRKRVGLIYSYNENWVAGSYYIVNIIHALNYLNDSDKPEIIVLTESLENFETIKKETKYPYLSFYSLPFKERYSYLDRIINRISKVVVKKKLIHRKHDFPQLDFVYPYEIEGLSQNLKKVNWVPDFQEVHLPQFFSDEEIKNRKSYQKNILIKSDVVVFSSLNTKKDFKMLYPDSKAKLFVLPFAVTHPDFSNEDIEKLKIKYNIHGRYFFVPNQFWAHKNHQVILRAVKALKDKGENVLVAFTGKEHDHRNKDNFRVLKAFVSENNLEENIRFLGFIDRKEQLCLMANSIAIVQPSLFEGWSTVVEDAKALNKFIILSGLDIHKEQINQNVTFFNPKDELELSNILANILKDNPVPEKIEYNRNIEKFASNFIELVNLVS